MYVIDFIKKIERSVSIILDILGNLGQFGHLYGRLDQPFSGNF